MSLLGIAGAGSTASRLARAALDVGVRVRDIPIPDAPPRDGPPPEVAALLARCDVVTASSELVSAQWLEAIAAVVPVRPAPAIVAVAQDRAREKEWIDPRAGTAAAWRAAASPEELAAAIDALSPGGEGCWVKARRRGTPPTMPVHVATADGAADAWEAMGRRACVVEQALPIVGELVALVARSGSGETTTFPLAAVERRGARVLWAAIPADVPEQVAQKATRLASFYANKLRVEGLLAIELFVLADGRLAVNELVPGPHPAFDATSIACETDQYAQCVRAVCGLPLGATTLRTPAASARLPEQPLGATAVATAAALVAAHEGRATPPGAFLPPRAARRSLQVSMPGETIGAAVEAALDAAERMAARQERASPPGGAVRVR